jgi:DNA-binding transcriptional ArsR family regulator
MAQKAKAKDGLRTDERLYKALSHPLRYRILVRLNERAASPSELAEALGEKIGNVAYHVRMLVELDAIELVRTRQVRGTVEHFYRAIDRPFLDDEHWSRLPVSVRRQFTDFTLQGLWEHVAEAAGAGGFDDREAHVSWTTLELDAEGRENVARILAAALDDVLAEHAASAGREVERAPSERGTERSELAIMHYRRPRPDDPA